MGRLVRVPREVSAAELSAGGFDSALQAGLVSESRRQTGCYVQADSYLDRIAKYVPAEILAFSVFVNLILGQALKNGGKTAMMAGFPVITIAAAAVIAGTLLTPFFVWYMQKKGDAWITNAFVSTLAFPFWAYALGSVAFADYWDGNLAAILLASFTVVSGFISPRMPRNARPRRDKDFDAEVPASAVKERPRLIEPAPQPIEALDARPAAVAARK